MKKFVVFIVSLALLISSLSITAFAAQQTLPEIDASLNIDSVTSNGNISSGSSFTVYFSVNASENDYGGTATATVSGSGFTVDGYRADYRISDPIKKGSSYAVPIFCEASTQTGRYPVILTVIYEKDGKSVTMSQTLNINVSGYTEPDLPETGDGTAVLDIISAPNGEVMAGNTFDVSFTSYCTAAGLNYGYGYGYGYTNGTVTVSGNGFSLAGALAEQNITGGTNRVSILADKNLESGRHQVTLQVTYKTMDGKTVSASKTLNIDITGGTEEVDESKDAPAFKLVAASIPESKGRANLSTKLKLSFENTTGFTAENVKIRLTNLGELILNTYTDTLEVGEVIGGQKVNATFPVKFPEQVLNPQIRLEATVMFDTAEGTQSVPYSIYLQADVTKEEEIAPEGDSLTPKVIVSQYNVDVEKVASGEQFTLTFTLKNTSADKDLYNMTVDVEPQGMTTTGGTSGPVFTFIDGTSSFYTEKLEKNGELEYSIRLKCSASAGAGSYPIRISYDYQYENHGQYVTPSFGNTSMDINIPVSQPIKFELVDWVAPTECPLDGLNINFQYYNKSRNPMTSLTIGVDGDDFTMPTQNMGTLNASSADYFNGTIVPADGAQVGDVKTVVLVFMFEDAAGEEQRVEERFDVTITEATGGMGGDMSYDDPMMGGDFSIDYGPGVMDPSIEYDENGMPINGDNVEESSGLPLWAKIAIPSAVGLVVVIAIVVIVKKVKAKKDDDDDED